MKPTGFNLIINIIFILSIGYAASSCRKASVEKIEKLLKEEKYPTETGRGVTFIYSDSAYIRAKLETPLMYKFIGEETIIEMPDGLNVTFFNKFTIPKSFLKAGYGIQYVDKKIIEVKENVVVVNIKGDTLTTEHLIWDERKNKIYSDKSVRVKTKDEIIYAKGFESNPSFSYYKFHDIKGIIQLKTPDEEEKK